VRFNWGKIPDDPEFEPEDQGWTALREPSPWVAQLMSLPVAVVTMMVTAGLWALFTPASWSCLNFHWSLVILLPGLIVVHETVHVLFHPGFGASAESVLGFWPSKCLFYAHFGGTWSKGKFLGCLLAPLGVISFLPVVLSAFSGYSSPVLAFLSVWNAVMSCVDILGSMFIAWQVPARGLVRNKGWYTYYRTDLEPESL
jgi:hypothetical protein